MPACERGVGVPIPTTGAKALHSVYSVWGIRINTFLKIFQVESDVYASHDSSVLSAEPSMLYDTNQTKEDLVKEIRKQQLLVLDNNETRL